MINKFFAVIQEFFMKRRFRKPMYEYEEIDLKTGQKYTVKRYPPSWKFRPEELISTLSDCEYTIIMAGKNMEVNNENQI